MGLDDKKFPFFPISNFLRFLPIYIYITDSAFFSSIRPSVLKPYLPQLLQLFRYPPSNLSFREKRIKTYLHRISGEFTVATLARFQPRIKNRSKPKRNVARLRESTCRRPRTNISGTG